MPITVNLVLGYFGTVPFGYAWSFLANYPLAALGWTERDPSGISGLPLWTVLLTGVLGGFLAGWAGINVLVRRLTGLPARRYWTMVTLVLLLPTAVFALLPEAWQPLGHP
ncbi:hypothetical protein [Streptomyces orinoci]|uniref:Uncharacterized protein n=1 Tax=Streptomyces orinoci TaxID=67339 RepID=A0ABV3K1R8_STRON|nr:hypothetical protein [Streptomyces orinoci]